MVEVDANVLIVGGTTVAALVGMMMCLGGDKKEPKAQAKKKEKEAKAPAKVKSAPKEEPLPKAKSTKEVKAKAPVKIEAVKKVTETIAPTPALAPSPMVDADADFVIPVKSKKKKQQKAKDEVTKKDTAAKSATTIAAPASTVGAPTAVATAPVKAPAAAPIADGWEMVDKKKSKPKKAAATAAGAAAGAGATSALATASTPEVPAADAPVTFNINVENKKLGIIIGVKGATLKAIQDATGTTINTPKNLAAATGGAAAAGVSVVTVTGPQEGVSRAAKAVGELAKKGYCSLLGGEDFEESPLAVHTSFVPDLVGKGGACIRALQEKLKVRVNISQTPAKDNTVKVVIAGAREDVATAKRCIADILSVRHSSVTHPNVVHAAVDVAPDKYKFIIGAKGAEIRHIENNFKVSLYIPSEIAPQGGKVLVVGEAAAVNAAERYVQKIIADKNEVDAALGGSESWEQEADGADEGPQEEWMQQYTFREQAQQIVTPSVLAAAAAPKPTSSAEATAWRDAAQGW